MNFIFIYIYLAEIIKNVSICISLCKYFLFILILIIPYRRCNKCNEIVESKFTFCTNCGEKLQLVCPSCKKEIHLSIKYCGWCGKLVEHIHNKKNVDEVLSEPLKNIVKKVKLKYEENKTSDNQKRFKHAIQEHANIRGFSINKANGKQKQIKEANKKVS